MSNKQRLRSALEDTNISGRIDARSLKKLTVQEQQLIHDLHNEGLVNEALKFIDSLDTDQEWELIKKKLNPSKKQEKPLWKSVFRYAAIFIGLLTIAYFVDIGFNTESGAQITEGSIKLKIGKDVIKVIRQGESRQLVSVSGKVVGEQVGNRIQYDPDAEIDELIYNELEIPYGKIFEVELSDGTLVHLNSGTKLRYPVKFLKGRKREVFIDGEAYFKVAKDREHPFIVNAGAVAVEVLGTEFNISSYKEDSSVRTVLVEGSVSMSNSVVPEEKVVLKPGYEGTWNKTAHTTETGEVDVDLYTGWTRGELIFRNSTFENMAKKLERRYNVTIQNDNLLLKDKILNARFNVDIESIEDVLKSINEIQPFNYKVTGKKIVIS